MARIKADPSGIAEIRTIVEQQAQTMQRVEQTIGQVLMNLDVKIAASENIRQSLTSLKSTSAKEQETLFGMSSALVRVNDEFQATDHELSEKAKDVNYALDSIIVDAATGFRGRSPLEIMAELLQAGALSTIFGLVAPPATHLDLQLLFGDTSWDILDGVSNMSSFIKDTGDYAEWIDVLFDSDMFGDISNQLKDVGKNELFKVAGYLDDGKKLIDALNTGDLDALENLSEKYLKKGVKSGIQLATCVKVSGVVNSVYLDLGWNLGENITESVQEIADDPSFGSAASGLWNITAGTFFDAGAGLAEDALSFVGDITGQGFDADDFGNAMDYLWNHPIESLVATGEVIVDGVASFFDWLF